MRNSEPKAVTKKQIEHLITERLVFYDVDRSQLYWFGRVFRFNSTETAFFKMLWENLLNGNRPRHLSKMITSPKGEPCHPYHAFRRNAAWQEAIIVGDGVGNYWLNVPEDVYTRLQQLHSPSQDGLPDSSTPKATRTISEPTVSTPAASDAKASQVRSTESRHSSPKPSSEALVLTIDEVARELRVSRAHVYNILNGKVPGLTPLPYIAIGRRRLIRRSTLEEWKATNERITADAMIRSSPEVDAAGA